MFRQYSSTRRGVLERLPTDRAHALLLGIFVFHHRANGHARIRTLHGNRGKFVLLRALCVHVVLRHQTRFEILAHEFSSVALRPKFQYCWDIRGTSSWLIYAMLFG